MHLARLKLILIVLMKRPELRSSPTCETQSCTFHDHIIVIDFQIYLFLSFKNFIHCPLVNMHQQFFKLKVMIAAEVRGERREVQEKREKLSLLRGKVPPRVRVFLRKLCISFLLCALMYLYIARSGT